MKSKYKTKIIYPKDNKNKYKRKMKHIEIEGNNEPKSKFKKTVKLTAHKNLKKLNINQYISTHFNIKDEYILAYNELEYTIPIPDEDLFLKKENVKMNIMITTYYTMISINI